MVALFALGFVARPLTVMVRNARRNGPFNVFVATPHDLSDGEGSFGWFDEYVVGVRFGRFTFKFTLDRGNGWQHID